MTNLKRLYIKTVSMLVRLFRAIWYLPIRIYRIAQHIWVGLDQLLRKKSRNTKHWWQDFAFLTMDLVALPEAYETLCEFAKWNTRPLNAQEKNLAASVYGKAINLDAVRLDDRAKIGCKKNNIAYVSFFTINAWGPMRPEIFIHELTHVWQYNKMGGPYILRALRAQKTKEGYNYGGAESLKLALMKNAKITDFNLEQQADILGDYYSIREGKKPAWGKGTQEDLPTYEYFVSQVRL